MKSIAILSLAVVAAASLSACSYPKKYECTITKNGKVVYKGKVNSKAECDAIALGF
jgi:outer membrane protein assembly factor BamE (lipoprotein component of BamABCDE complex)